MAEQVSLDSSPLVMSSPDMHQFTPPSPSPSPSPLNSGSQPIIAPETPLIPLSDDGPPVIHDLLVVGFGPAALAIATAYLDSPYHIPSDPCTDSPVQSVARPPPSPTASTSTNTTATTPSTSTSPPMTPLKPTPRIKFLTASPTPAWHPGALLPRAQLQVSFLKDLATQRDPRSPWTFVNYLHRVGRLSAFVNAGAMGGRPSRREWAAYLRWVGEGVDRAMPRAVAWGVEVRAVRPVWDDGVGGGPSVRHWSVQGVRVHDGLKREWLARHVVFATGGSPCMPSAFAQAAARMSDVGSGGQAQRDGGDRDGGTGDGKPQQPEEQRQRIVHSIHYAFIPAATIRSARRIAVVGGGQSAAEVFEDLLSKSGCRSDAEVHLLIRGDALKAVEDSPFVNEVFDGSKIDAFHAASADRRAQVLHGNRATNYGVVRIELLNRIYELLYAQKIEGDREEGMAGTIFPRVDIWHVLPKHESVALDISYETEVGVDNNVANEYDLVIVATGFKHDSYLQLLDDASLGNQGDWKVQRDYRLNMPDVKLAKDTGIWLQGCNEKTHGLSDMLLSVLAIRGEQLIESIFNKFNKEE